MKKLLRKNLFVFDVEATSLHGEGFAVGAVVMTPNGEVIDKFELLSRQGAEGACDWVRENALPHLEEMPTVETLLELREEFWKFYMKYKDSCNIFADVAYPVETNFLEEVCFNGQGERDFMMPYPLYDIANFLDVDIDRYKFAKLEGCCMQKHHPLNDAETSAYALLKVLKED